MVKCSQYKNDAIQLKNVLILKLRRLSFSVTYMVKEKGGNFKAKKFFNWVASFLYWLCFRFDFAAMQNLSNFKNNLKRYGKG